MFQENNIFDRTELLLGQEAMARIATTRVILFGVGGVGSWCAESLVRSGIGHLTMVDCDTVNVSNLNRQLQATTLTVGRLKVEALKERLLSINPEADITAVSDLYSAENADSFHLEDYDIVIDAIDSLTPKAHLILHATSLPLIFVSSMGSALKMDPTKIRVDEFWKVQYCPLARALRKKFKHWQKFPERKFLCVHSPEVLGNKDNNINDNWDNEDNFINNNNNKDNLDNIINGNDNWDNLDNFNRNNSVDNEDNFKKDNSEDSEITERFHKVQTNGTIAHITAIFGFTLAGIALQLRIMNYEL